MTSLKEHIVSAFPWYPNKAASLAEEVIKELEEHMNAYLKNYPRSGVPVEEMLRFLREGETK